MSGNKVTNQELASGAAQANLGFTPENTANKGVANGYAPLDATSKVPTANLPALNYVPTSSEGVANGVATLDSTGNVPSSQLGNVSVPVATASTAGKVKIGNGIVVQGDGTISTKVDPLLIWMNM